MKKKLTILVLAGILLVGISTTYGKWEFLTIKYAKEFKGPIEAYQSKANSWIDPGIKKLKVFNYASNIAQIFLEDGIGNKWILNFKKDKNENWTIEYDGVHHLAIIHSKRGGSANQLIYWY